MTFDYGILEVKRRFSLSLPLSAYTPVVLDNVIQVGLVLKYYTVACDNLVYEVQVVRRVSCNQTECLKYDLHDFTFKILYKGEACFNF